MAHEPRRKAGSGRGQRDFGKIEGDAINHFIGLGLKDGGFAGFFVHSFGLILGNLFE
jgi:hypothetical protein